MSGATTTGGLVQAPGGGPGITSTGGSGGGVADQPAMTTGQASPPRIILDLEGHRIELGVQDIFLLSLVVLLFADVVVGIAEVIQ